MFFSFIRSTYNLPNNVSHAPSLSIFKSKINSDITKSPKHFYFCFDRKSQMYVSLMYV